MQLSHLRICKQYITFFFLHLDFFWRFKYIWGWLRVLQGSQNISYEYTTSGNMLPYWKSSFFIWFPILFHPIPSYPMLSFLWYDAKVRLSLGDSATSLEISWIEHVAATSHHFHTFIFPQWAHTPIIYIGQTPVRSHLQHTQWSFSWISSLALNLQYPVQNSSTPSPHTYWTESTDIML